MADITDPIRDLFVADSGAGGMNTLLTGGTRIFRELTRKGISRTTTPTAYDDSGLLRPNCVIKQRGQIPTYELADEDDQYVSTRQMLELWLYADDDYTVIAQARERAYVLLHETNIANVGRLILVNQIDDARDPSLNDSAMLRADYQVDSQRSV